MVMCMQNKSNETDTVCRDESQHGRYIAKVCQVLYLFVSLLSVNVRGKGVEMFGSSLPGYSRWLPIDVRRELVPALGWLYLQVRPAASALVDLADLRMGQPDLSSCIFYPLCRWDNIKKKIIFFFKIFFQNFLSVKFFFTSEKFQFFFTFLAATSSFIRGSFRPCVCVSVTFCGTFYAKDGRSLK